MLRTFSRSEAAELTAAWLAVYRPHREGINVNRYLWHVFGGLGDTFACLSGAEAVAAYRQREAPEYWVLSNDRRLAFATDCRPERVGLSDSLVFPPNFAWTMAFTHEDGWLGPFFATHPDVARLDAENLMKIRKRREVEEAKAKGWI